MEGSNKMKRILALLIVTLIVIGSAASFAESVFTPDCQARIAARDALFEKYGLDQKLQAFFSEVLIKENDGYRVVYYPNFDELTYVLGAYTVKVNGSEISASWSWDGKEIPNEGCGLAAHAWDKDQLTEIWLINKQLSNCEYYCSIARSLASVAGFNSLYEYLDLPDDEDAAESAEYDPSKAKLTQEESIAIAKQAIKEAYRLSDEQISRMRIQDDSEWYYANAKGEPVMDITFILWNDNGVLSDWQEGNGNYFVTVNQTTGLVENISYITGIIGNG